MTKFTVDAGFKTRKPSPKDGEHTWRLVFHRFPVHLSVTFAVFFNRSGNHSFSKLLASTKMCTWLIVVRKNRSHIAGFHVYVACFGVFIAAARPRVGELHMVSCNYEPFNLVKGDLLLATSFATVYGLVWSNCSTFRSLSGFLFGWQAMKRDNHGIKITVFSSLTCFLCPI